MRHAPLSSPSNRPPTQDIVDIIAGYPERRVSSASIVIENNKGEALVVKASYKPYWSLPGGIIDTVESPKEAAARELQEETGISISVDDLDFMTVIHRYSSQANTYSFVFSANQPFEESQTVAIDNDEIVDFAWVSKSDVNNNHNGEYNLAVSNWASASPEAYIDQPLGDN